MTTKIAIAMALALGCQTATEEFDETGVWAHEPGEHIAPPEKSWDEMGLAEPGAEELSNLVNAPLVNESDDPHTPTITERGGMGVSAMEYATHDMNGNLLPVPPRTRYTGAIMRTEALRCVEGDCAFDTRYHHPDGTTIDDVEAIGLGLPVEPTPSWQVHGEPADFWATGPVAGASSQPQNPPFTACVGLPDQCRPGFEPWCNGGVGFLSPGGIAETSVGCRGTEINYGGPGNIRPDNAHLRVSYWNGTRGSCDDLTYSEVPELLYVIDRLNGAERTLPNPYTIAKTACDPNTQAPGGYGLCPDGVKICPLDSSNLNPTLIDVMYQLDTLSDVAQTHHCAEARNAQAGKNRANARTIGCTTGILEKDASNIDPRIRHWNNGYDNHAYWTLRGTIVTLDPAAIEWMATYSATKLDRGGLNTATRRSYLKIHVLAHETGHSLGMQHAYIGPDGNPRWVQHSRGGWVSNPNIIPYSVMHRTVPAAPYTTSLWSSGLLADLQNIDLANTGGGNLEGWRMSNIFRSVYDGQSQSIRNTWGPPLTETNNEL